MGRKVKQFKNYSSEQIKKLIDNDYKYRLGICLYAVHQLSKGKSIRDLEGLYNISFKQIYNGANRFDKEGIDGLTNRPRSGRPAKLTQEQLTTLQSCLKKARISLATIQQIGRDL